MRLVAIAVLLATPPVHADAHRPTLDPFAAQPMKGPFPSIAAFCKKGLEVYTDTSVRALLEPRCDDGIVTIDPASPGELVAPFQALSVVDLPELPQRVLAAKVGGAWYVRELDPFEDPPNCHGKTTVEAIVARGAALEVSYTIDGGCEHRDWDWTWIEHAFVVVGVGASQRPSVTRPFEVAVSETDTTEGKPHTQFMDLARTATWSKDGSVDIAITRAIGAGLRTDGMPGIQGHHTFTFH